MVHPIWDGGFGFGEDRVPMLDPRGEKKTGEEE